MTVINKLDDWEREKFEEYEKGFSLLSDYMSEMIGYDWSGEPYHKKRMSEILGKLPAWAVKLLDTDLEELE